MISFLVLRVRFPRMARPYRSPVGMAGAVAALAIAGLTLFTLFRNPDYNKGVIGAAVWFLLGIGYHAVHGRHGLVLAPEEEAAMRLRAEREV